MCVNVCVCVCVRASPRVQGCATVRNGQDDSAVSTRRPLSPPSAQDVCQGLCVRAHVRVRESERERERAISASIYLSLYQTPNTIPQTLKQCVSSYHPFPSCPTLCLHPLRLPLLPSAPFPHPLCRPRGSQKYPIGTPSSMTLNPKPQTLDPELRGFTSTPLVQGAVGELEPRTQQPEVRQPHGL